MVSPHYGLFKVLRQDGIVTDHLLKLRLPICTVLADSTVTGQDHHHLDLQPSLWDLLEQLRDVLYPFQVAAT